MADFCYFCKKKIGLFEKISSQRIEEQTVCGDCVDKAKRIARLYNRTISEYSLGDMGTLIKNAASFEAYLNGYEKIQREYEKKITPYKKLLEEDKNDLRETEKDREKSGKSWDKEIAEVEKERRKDLASAEYKSIVRDYERAQRSGDTVVMRTAKGLMDSAEKRYLESLSDIEQSRANDNAHFQEMLAWMKVDVDGDETIIDMLEDYCAVKKYVYQETEVPSEKLVLGHELERHEEENRGKAYIKWYLSKILKIEAAQLQDAEKNDLIFVRFGKKLLESNLENTFRNYYQNETNLERLDHELKFAIMIYQGEKELEKDPKYITKAKNDLDKIYELLEESETEKPKIDSEFQKKEEKLKTEFLELLKETATVQNDVQKLPDTQDENLIRNIRENQEISHEKPTSIENITKIMATAKNGSEGKKVCCGQCGKENKAGAKFCKFCGSPIAEEKARFCTECGNKIKPGKKFCSACGAKVED